MKHVDVAIIGGSLAGAACVRELARRGIDAMAFQRDRFPREKVCGGFLSPGAVDLLNELEVLDAVRAAGAPTVHASTIRIGEREIQVELPRPGLGISRRTLDAIVADHPGVQQGFVRSVNHDGGKFRVQLEAAEISARIVVDAAGKLSRFSRRRAVPQFGVQFYEADSRGDVLDFWFFEEGYGGAVTVEGGRSNACFLISKDAMQALFHSQDPAVQVLLAPLRGASGVQPTFPGALRAGPLARRRRARMVARGERAISEPPLVIGLVNPHPDRGARGLKAGVLVTGPLAYDRLASDFITIGDAAGMVDPFCGEGMRHALDTGICAAMAIASGLNRGENYDVMRTRYEQDSSRRWNRKRRLAKIIRHMLKHPRLTCFGLGLNPEYWFRKLWD